ncbi:MAG: glycosyltransferase family 2 protein [Lachnospiraceae bacterium]|nr:glycosyltransferase family 2 protein [Lachnospiraceae bacterium]
MEFSVIVTNFNSDFNKIKMTIDSILIQERITFEIIVCDDCSGDNHFAELDAYLEDKNVPYKLLGAEKNTGTVKNVLKGLRVAEGRYAKLIGVGDMLYAPNTLRSVRNFMDRTEIDYCFGAMQGYRKTMDGYESVSHYSPRDIVAYRNQEEERIYHNIMVAEDWISGAAIFAKTDFYLKYISMLENEIIYCEDSLTALAMVDHNVPLYINRYLILYEVGEGISTSSNEEFRKKVKADNDKFWELFDDYCGYRKATEFFKYIKLRRRKKRFEHLKNQKIKMGYKAIVAPELLLFEANARMQIKKGYHIPPVKPQKNMIELIVK